SPQIPETIEFHDIAGLVRGASAGEGLGNRFLAEIRETDAICHVVRTHGDERVPHPDGRVHPAADAEVVDAELLLADLDQAERRLERVRKEAASGAKEVAAERDWLERVVEAIGRGEPARALRRGLTAWDAAGKVHTDIQAGFVRAEVIGWRELVEAGGYAEARERGLIRTEGRAYVVRDGDVITIRH